MPALVVISNVGAAVLHVQLHQALVELALAQPLAQLFARALDALARLRLRRHQQVEQALFGVRLGAVRHFVQPLFAHHVDGDIHQVADHRLHVAAHVAHFGELAGLHLQERRIRQPRQAPRQFRLAHARGADHEDVLRHHLFGHLGRAASGGGCGCAARWPRRAWPPPAPPRACPARARSRAESARPAAALRPRTGREDRSPWLLQLLVGDVVVRVDADLAGDLHGLLGDPPRRELGVAQQRRGRRQWRRARPSRWPPRLRPARSRRRCRSPGRCSSCRPPAAALPGAAARGRCAIPWPVPPPSAAGCR